MGHKLKILGGKDVIKIIESYGFTRTRSVGSHVRMTYVAQGKSFHITIPLHTELKRGTLTSIIKELEGCVSGALLEKDFFTK